MALISSAQKPANSFPFTVRLEQKAITNLPALQSFAFATWQGKWLLVGGRKDGLHRREPFASFDEIGQNKFIYVIDPINKKVWKQPVKNLPPSIAEQFQSTNMEFCQMGNKLILAGGYGFSKSSDEHITYPRLTVIQVDRLINQIVNGKPPKNVIVQIKDERMAVTGGRLAKSGDTLILAGGQRFEGSYNPISPDHGPGYVQEYTNEIRKFRIEYEDEIPVIRDYTAVRDTINLHRRDYNLVPQIFKNEVPAFTMFSGVFQYNQDLPFTNFVDIVDGNYKVNNEFNQQFSHYHCAVLPIYEKATQSMFSIFFGGIAQSYPTAKGKIVNDKDVPFTKTISVIIRKGDATEEIILPIKMPGYMGAAAEFIFSPSTKLFKESIADGDALENKEVLIGYIVGGINSSAKNIFWDNTGKESKANNQIIGVYLKRKSGNVN